MSKRNLYLFCLLLALAFSANANSGSSFNPGSIPNITPSVSSTEYVAVRQHKSKDASNTPLILSIMALILSCGNVAYTIMVQQKSKKTRTEESNCTSPVDPNSIRKKPNAKKESHLGYPTYSSKKEKRKKGKKTRNDNQPHVAVQETQSTQTQQNIVQESKETPKPPEALHANPVKADKPSVPPPQKQPQIETYYVQPRMNGASIVLIDAGEQNRAYAPLKIVSQKGKVAVYFNEDSLVNNLVNIEKSILPYVETATLNVNSPRSVVTKNPGMATPQSGYWMLSRKPVVDII